MVRVWLARGDTVEGRDDCCRLGSRFPPPVLDFRPILLLRWLWLGLAAGWLGGLGFGLAAWTGLTAGSFSSSSGPLFGCFGSCCRRCGSGWWRGSSRCRRCGSGWLWGRDPDLHQGSWPGDALSPGGCGRLPTCNHRSIRVIGFVFNVMSKILLVWLACHFFAKVIWFEFAFTCHFMS